MDDAAQLHQKMLAMNEALLLGSVRQHELTAAAEKLNEQLRAEIEVRIHAEGLLRDSEERYRTLFDLGPVAVYSIDSSGVIQKYNRKAAELWGREPESGDTDERFRGSFKLFRPDGSFMPQEQWPMAEVVSGKLSAARDVEVLMERPDGSRITVVVNILPLKNQRGDITGAINCFYDISERIRMERERQQQTTALADLNRRKDEFLAMLSHELRAPLAPIANAVHLLGFAADEDMQGRARAIIGRQ